MLKVMLTLPLTLLTNSKTLEMRAQIEKDTSCINKSCQWPWQYYSSGMNWSIQKGKIFQGRASEDHTRISIPCDMMMIQELKKWCLKLSGTRIFFLIWILDTVEKNWVIYFFFSEFWEKKGQNIPLSPNFFLNGPVPDLFYSLDNDLI